MTQYLRTLIYLCTLALGLSRLEAEEMLPPQLSEGAEISILVASPSSEEVYTYYGHAGLCIEDPEQGLDVTFNYGIFNFSDDFIYRFIKGQTDYLVMPQHTSEYLDTYLSRGSYVQKLVLSLSSLERSKVWQYLLNNIKPEHRVYRYQFFRDNCSTRPLEIIEQAVGGLVYPSQYVYPKHIVETSEGSIMTSWRDEINSLEASSPWLVLGTDLCLGKPTDEKMSYRDYAFSPRHLEQILKHARNAQGETILKRVELFEAHQKASASAESTEASPILIFSIIALLVAFIYLYLIAYKQKHIARGLDLLLFVPAGLGGSVLFFISVISEHQFVFPNYNLWVLHPLHLLLVLGLLPCVWARYSYIYYHFANFVSILIFLVVAWLLPQHFNVALFLMAFTLGIASLGRCLEYYRAR